MAQFHNALACAAIATFFWGSLGYSLACCLQLPRPLRVPLAPTLGWAVHSILALPVFLLTGMTTATVMLAAALPAMAAAVAYARRRHDTDDGLGQARLPGWCIATAGAFACAILLGILPQISADGVALAQPVFDHAKVAIIDDIARLGVPAGNPFFAEAGGFARLFYYYLWHFSAAELAIVIGVSGWEADAAMTGFTALCSLLLMMGCAVWASGTAISAGWALMLAATTSIRKPAMALLGDQTTVSLIGDPTGFGSWLFQMSWAPQHVASANCVLIAILLLIQLAHHPMLRPTVALGCVAAAAFGSSTWVGGVTFPLAAATITPLLLWQMPPERRRQFLMQLAIAAVLAVGLAAPFLIDQFKAAALRGDGLPIAVAPFDTLSDDFSPLAHLVLKIPVYLSIFLYVEFAAFYPVGFFAAAWLAQDHLLALDHRRTIAALALVAGVGLAIGGLLASTTAANNDLAWRGVLPSLLILVSLTAAGLGRYLTSMRPLLLPLLLVPIGFAVANGLYVISGNLVVSTPVSAQRFVKSAAMWAAVRRHTGTAERIANNANFLRDMTTWPINISWALLSQRRSCFAGEDLALPFAPLTRQQRMDVEKLFNRAFAGTSEPGELALLRDHYQCDVVILTPDDGAWLKDPLASDPTYRLVESDPAAWRIYRRSDR